MCGIAGFFGLGNRSDLERMTRALAHRGPDGENFYIDQAMPVFLGHRRLAIVDIASGKQPMWNENGQVGVVFNGEIYNQQELREELIQRGHRFVSSHCDTEVLVHGYEEWGEQLPQRLNGMFAFAIYDKPRKRLFLARDRFGEKPLYYAHRPNLFAFASELTALAQHQWIDRQLDTRSLKKFFAYGYLPAPHAILKSVRKLPGGHWLSYDINEGTFVIKRYWRFVVEPNESLRDADESRLVDECDALLTQAVCRRLMSDVPLGVFLSGGLDSSSVVASMTSTLPPSRIRTFTIGFTEPTFDERAHARVVSQHLGSVHQERLLDFDHAKRLIPAVLGRLDEPLGDPSIIPTHLLCAFAREQVKVALTGDGGDELFAGYDPFLALAPARAYSRVVPGWGHKALRRVAELMPISHANMSLDFKLRQILTGLSYPEEMWLPVWMAPSEPKHLRELFETPIDIEDVYEEAITIASDPDKSAVDRALEFFTQLYLPDDILMKTDRAAMMCSLETRAVFLDNDLVEFCRRLPHRFKFRNGERKYLLKQVARRYLPTSIVERKKKGFGMPVAKWLLDWPTTMPIRPIPGCCTTPARRAFAEHRTHSRDHRLFLWSWFSAQLVAQGLQTLQESSQNSDHARKWATA